jgi:NAD(P)-dependent dehydrogenase (short-subunit alcohol dehydrogenase family)
MRLLEDKVALITGAGQGIGKVIAEIFVKQGAKVVIGDIKEDWVNNLATELNQKRADTAVAIYLDISDPKSVDSAVNTAVETFGQLNVLVNNAGIHRSHPFLDFTLKDRQPQNKWSSKRKGEVSSASRLLQEKNRTREVLHIILQNPL